ncbi:MAG TPA: hypothetical protein VN604_06660 [Nitrospirota bacterium]|nr:hypothetical protein [Nitrospirota bacterium]
MQRYTGISIVIAIALSMTLASCGGGDKGGGGFFFPVITPEFNHYLAGTYEVYTIEQEYTDVNVRHFTATSDGSGSASVSVGGGGTMTARYSISSDRSISLSIPADPTMESSSGIVSADGSIAVLADTNLSGPGTQFDVEISIFVRRTTGMTAQIASGEYILCQVGKAATDTYTLFAAHSRLIVRDDGTGSITGLSRSEGTPAPETEITFLVADNGTFTAGIGGISFGGIISPNANMFVMTDTGDGTDVSLVVGVRRSPWTMPAFGGSFREIVVGHELLVTGPQFTARLSASVHESFPQLSTTTIADSRGTPAGTTDMVGYSPKDDGMLFRSMGYLARMADPPYGIVSPDGGFYISWDTSRNPDFNDHKIALVLGVQTAKAQSPFVPVIPEYLFYSDGAGGLVAVNVFEAMEEPPVGPGGTSLAAKSVASGVEAKSVTLFGSGTYLAAAKQLAGQKIRSVLYAAGGRLQRISALSGSSLMPMQVSNETEAAGICTTMDVMDYADFGNSLYIYMMPGANGVCGTGDDDVMRAVRLNMTASDPPLEITSLNKMPVGALYDLSTAGRTGLLVMNFDGSTLERCSSDLTVPNCSVIANNVTKAGMLGIDIATGRIALWIDNGSEYSVRVYDPAGDTLSASLFTPASEPGESLQDASGNIYILEGPGTVKKLMFGATPGVSTLVTEMNDIIDAKLTTGRLVYLTRGETNNGDGTYTVASAIKSITLSGQDAKELIPMTDTVTWTGHRPLELYAAAGNALFGGAYYNKYDGNVVDSTIVPTAGYIYDDASGPVAAPAPPQQETADAEWTALTWNTTTQLPAEGTVDRIIMSRGESMFGGHWDAVPYNASTYSPGEAFHPAFPDSDFHAGLRGQGIGRYLLCTAQRAADPYKNDIFLVDIHVSADQITNTPGVNEAPIGK